MSAIDAFLHSLRTAFGFTPTSDQEKCMHQFSQFFFQKGEQELFLLNGYAGTGKTRLISAITHILPSYRFKVVLLAPTGKAAKVMSNYSGIPAQTIHRKIYRKDFGSYGGVAFYKAENLHKNTLFIVDEASMIGGQSSSFNGVSFHLLSDMLSYVFSGENCKLMFVGDTAQLPPIGSDYSPALDPDYMRQLSGFTIHYSELKQVTRQKEDSGILYNATQLRIALLQDQGSGFPTLSCFPDVVRLEGDELEDALNDAYRKFGWEETLVISPSNKRANAFNQQIRHRIRWQENQLSSGDLAMAVKNNYFWLEAKSEAGFIANGDGLEILKISGTEQRYGFEFADVQARLIDYPNMPNIELKVMLDAIAEEGPSVASTKLQHLYEQVKTDAQMEQPGVHPYALIRNNPYLNALQIKFNYAITCHKSQGGQWPCIFIDQGYLTEERMNKEFIRWLYTALTRATEKVYLINFHPRFFES